MVVARAEALMHGKIERLLKLIVRRYIISFFSFLRKSILYLK